MNKGGVKKRFRDMKLTGKMVVIYLLAGLVPVMIILGITSVSYTHLTLPTKA